MNPELQQFLLQNNIKYRPSGQNVEIGCLIPSCPNHGQPQMYIHQQTGQWICHRCGTKGGTIKQLAFLAGLVELKPKVIDKSIFISPDVLSKWCNDLFKHEDALDYLTRVRGFTPDTLKEFQVGWKQENDQSVLVLPYFDLHKACVGYKKYYYKGDVKPKCKLEKGSKIQFFNLNRINFSEPLWITEGEWDAITLWQYGFRNVGSVPNGANGINGWTSEISKIPSYLLATDNDPSGEDCANQLGERLGRARCRRVYPRLKDYNEYLQCGLSKKYIEEDIEQAQEMFTPADASTLRYVEGAVELAVSPEKRKGQSTGWITLDTLFGGWRLGEITTITGETGNGKSAFSLANIAHWLDTGSKVAVFSGEMSGSDVLFKLASNKYKRQAREEDIYTYAQHYQNKIYIPNIYEEWEDEKTQLPIDKLFDMIDYYIAIGVQYFVIDHIHCFIRKGKNMIEDIEDFMTRCRIRVKSHPIHLFLVAQCRKKDKDKRRLTKDDLYGSSEIDHASWNIWVIHRDSEKDHTVSLFIEKNRSYGGVLGSCQLQFDMNTQANYYEVKRGKPDKS